MPTKHALLSASSSARWLACPPSARLCARAPDQSSSYAQEGTDAHSLCEYLVLRALGRRARDPTEDLSFYDAEMQACAEGYRDFVMEQVTEAKERAPNVEVNVEQRLDFSRWVPEGFGTGDCVIVTDGLIHIVDFKYGLGVLVSASGKDGKGNPQLLCYALGALDAYDFLYDIKEIKLSIFQPRRDNVNTFTISREDLLTWANTVLAPAAKLAIAGKGEFQAGDHCRFCKIKASCRERANYNLELAKYDFEEPAELDQDEIAAILPRVDSLVSWAQDIKDYALYQALSGVKYDGFKVVEGRSNRKYTNDEAVAAVVEKAGFDPYEKKLRGVTAMTRELGKKKFAELLGDLVYKPPGKPVLVSESDKRPEMNTAVNDFMEETDYE